MSVKVERRMADGFLPIWVAFLFLFIMSEVHVATLNVKGVIE